jgi:hypothetical protein
LNKSKKEIDFYIFLERRQNQRIVYFSRARNLLQRKILTSKSEYVSSKFEENKDDPKKLWQHMEIKIRMKKDSF